MHANRRRCEETRSSVTQPLPLKGSAYVMDHRDPHQSLEIAEQTGVVLSAMVSIVTMKTATAEDEGLPIIFLDIDDVLCLNNPYGGSDALEAVKGRHADPDMVLREIFAAEPKRVLESVHKAMGG